MTVSSKTHFIIYIRHASELEWHWKRSKTLPHTNPFAAGVHLELLAAAQHLITALAHLIVVSTAHDNTVVMALVPLRSFARHLRPDGIPQRYQRRFITNDEIDVIMFERELLPFPLVLPDFFLPITLL